MMTSNISTSSGLSFALPVGSLLIYLVCFFFICTSYVVPALFFGFTDVVCCIYCLFWLCVDVSFIFIVLAPRNSWIVFISVLFILFHIFDHLSIFLSDFCCFPASVWSQSLNFLTTYFSATFFFLFYLAVPWSILGYFRGDSFTNLMIITAFSTALTQCSLGTL